MSTAIISIIIDDREKGSDVYQTMQQMPNLRIDIRRLPVGDYLVDQRLLFERKTFADLILSIKDGRLFAQAKQLASCKWPVALILQGTSQELKSHGMRREAIQGAIISLSMRFGIPVLRAKDAAECARIMIYAARQTDPSIVKISRRPGIQPKGKKRLQLHVLTGLPGIGPVRALRLINHFVTLEKIFTVSIDELQKVGGIGMGTAKKIYTVIHFR